MPHLSEVRLFFWTVMLFPGRQWRRPHKWPTGKTSSSADQSEAIIRERLDGNVSRALEEAIELQGQVILVQ